MNSLNWIETLLRRLVSSLEQEEDFRHKKFVFNLGNQLKAEIHSMVCLAVQPLDPSFTSAADLQKPLTNLRNFCIGLY